MHFQRFVEVTPKVVPKVFGEPPLKFLENFHSTLLEEGLLDTFPEELLKQLSDERIQKYQEKFH